MGEDVAELVAGDLAHERRLAAERRQSDTGIRHSAAADLDARPHGFIQAHRLARIDQAHGALLQPLLDDEAFVAARDDIDDGAAEADDVIERFIHQAVLAMS